MVLQLMRILDDCDSLLYQQLSDFTIDIIYLLYKAEKPSVCRSKFCDTNFMLCVLLESIDLMLLTLTRRTYKAIGGLGNYLGIANWMNTWNR